jgi:hypothetical protein
LTGSSFGTINVIPKIGEGAALTVLRGENVMPKSVVAELVESNSINMQTTNVALLLPCLFIVIDCNPFLQATFD